MQAAITTTLVLLLLASASAGAATATSTQQHYQRSTAAPLFAWSSVGYFSGGEDNQRHAQTLQVYDSLHDAVQTLLHAFSDSKRVTGSRWVDPQLAQQQKPDIVIVVLGSQLRTSHLKNRVLQKTLHPLKTLLDQSTSSLAVPYVLHEDGADVHSHVGMLEQMAAGMQLTASVVGCSTDNAGGLDAVLQRQEGHQQPQLVVLCTQPPPANESGTREAVASELQQLQEAHDAVAVLGKKHVAVYAAVPDGAVGGLPARRQLQSVHADIGTCGQLCQTQVKWLEGILAALLMAIAAFSGMCCLYMLDTPTRFEKPKEGGRND